MQTSISKTLPIEIVCRPFLGARRKVVKAVFPMPATACGHPLHRLSRLHRACGHIFSENSRSAPFRARHHCPTGRHQTAHRRAIWPSLAAVSAPPRESKRLEIKAKIVLWIEKMLNLQTQHSQNLIRCSLKVYFFSGISQQCAKENDQ